MIKNRVDVEPFEPASFASIILGEHNASSVDQVDYLGEDEDDNGRMRK